MQNIIELIGYGFFQRALVVSVVVSVLMALIGTYVVLRHLAFIGAGIAHASFGGIALGLLLGWSPVGMAGVFAGITALGIAWVEERTPIHEDTAIGIFFAFLMALGIFGMGFYKGYAGNLFGYLFGNVLGVTSGETTATLGIGVGILGILFFFDKEFLLITFDREYAQILGFPVRGLNVFQLLLIATVVVLSLRLVGVVLASALLVIPPATAQLVARTFRQMQLFAVMIGVTSSILGIFLAYLFDAPTGATVVLCAGGIFFGVFAFQHFRNLKGG